MKKIILAMTALVLVANVSTAGVTISGGPQLAFMSNEGGASGGVGFVADLGVAFSDGVGAFMTIGTQSLGSVEFETATILLDDFGVGTFTGTQEHDYAMSYYAFGLRVGSDSGSSAYWGDFGLASYSLKTEVQMNDGFFEYTDGYGYYSTPVPAMRDEESIHIWGFSIGAGARTQLGSSLFGFLRADTHFIPIEEKSAYTRSEDGLMTVLSMQLGVGFSIK